MQQVNKKYGFSREERLRSKKVMGKLFSRNDKEVKSFLAFPYKFVFYFQESATASFPEVLISVPKRVFKKAHDRNKIKRLTKEAYRLNKMEFPKKVYLGLVYVGKEMLDFNLATKSIQKGLAKIEI